MQKSSPKVSRKRSSSPTAERVEHVRVLVYREGDLHLAHCLEFDLVAQGDTQAEALRGIGNAIDAMLAYAREHDDSRLLYRPAPPELWEKFERARMRKRRGGRTPRVRPEMELVTA